MLPRRTVRRVTYIDPSSATGIWCFVADATTTNLLVKVPIPMKKILKSILYAAAALALGLVMGVVAGHGAESECKPALLDVVHVHTWNGQERALLVFAFVDTTCDSRADIVFVYRYLGRFNGAHLFEKIGVTDPNTANKIIEEWREKTRTDGRSC